VHLHRILLHIANIITCSRREHIATEKQNSSLQFDGLWSLANRRRIFSLIKLIEIEIMFCYILRDVVDIMHCNCMICTDCWKKAWEAGLYGKVTLISENLIIDFIWILVVSYINLRRSGGFWRYEVFLLAISTEYILSWCLKVFGFLISHIIFS